MTHRSHPTLRRYDGDMSGCLDCFIEAVHHGTAPHYSAAQAQAWAPEGARGWDWEDRLSKSWTWVAMSGASVEGFAALRSDGYLDFLYVRPPQRGTGLASALYQKILEDGRLARISRYSCDASLLARPFLERRGWSVISQQTIQRNGVTLPRFAMALDRSSGQPGLVI